MTLPTYPKFAPKKVLLFPYFRARTRSSSYLTHVSDKHRVVYVEVPKAGCTVVKRVLQYNESPESFDPHVSDVHDRRTSPLLRPEHSSAPVSTLFGPAGDYFRFAFVRDPFGRALSAYLDKIVGHQAERDYRLPKLGVDPRRRLSFIEFLDRVHHQPLHRMDIHWAPQAALLAMGRINYDFIGRFENLSSDLHRLSGIVPLNFPNELVDSVTPHATGASQKTRQYYTAEAADLVRRIYRADFDVFAYPDDFEG